MLDCRISVHLLHTAAGLAFADLLSASALYSIQLPRRCSSLVQASAPDLRQLMARGRSGHLPGSPGAAAGLLVQRSASSATMGKAFSRWVLHVDRSLLAGSR